MIQSGTLTAAGPSKSVSPAIGRDFNVTLSGTFGATLQLERSFDNGSTWVPYTYIDGSSMTWSAPMSTSFAEGEQGVEYRLNCTSYSSGTIAYRISQ